MKRLQMRVFFYVAVLAFASCEKEDDETQQPEATVFKAAGNIEAKLGEFRNLLGEVNTAPGAVTGRREVNWDGVPDSLLNKELPLDFFNPVGVNAPAARQRGLAYSNGIFQVSASNFAEVNSEAASEFSAFSGDKVFANVSRSQWPVEFRVPGQATLANVQAFGMVFSDVDAEGSTTLEFFDGAESLGKFPVPPHDASGSFSFLGLHFNDRTITKVVVTHQGILSKGEKDISQGGTNDLIVVDDLIYSEPRQQQQ